MYYPNIFSLFMKKDTKKMKDGRHILKTNNKKNGGHHNKSVCRFCSYRLSKKQGREKLILILISQMIHVFIQIIGEVVCKTISSEAFPEP